MTEPATYSLWLQPAGEVAHRLQEQIKRLSKKHETPVFSPHVTLLGGLDADTAELIPLVDTLASTLQPFELVLTKTGYRDTYYQSLFIHIKKSKQLKKIRKTACCLFDISDRSYMPHLSLLYGNFSPKEKELMMNDTGRELNTSFNVKSIVLMQTGGKPSRWRKMHSAIFKNKL